MANSLRTYFPTLQSREEILGKIHGSKELEGIFYSWQEKQREEFLDFCTGAKGVKMLYDFCIKAILNPEIYPERLEELISLLLGKKVKLLKVLPNDNTRIADESSLLIMDFLVRLSDGSVVNVEVQKVGYAFPGQRSACYSADLLLREYKQVRNLLQKFIFVALDIYRKKQQNMSIKNRLNGWLTFLSSDAPEDIIGLIEKYPDSKLMYAQVYEICQNIEQVMGMFSKELYELDRNTVRYMIDELQEENKRWKERDKRNQEEIEHWEEVNRRNQEENLYLKQEIDRLRKELGRKRGERGNVRIFL